VSFLVGGIYAFSSKRSEGSEARKEKRDEAVKGEVARYKKADKKRKKESRRQDNEQQVSPAKQNIKQAMDAAEALVVNLNKAQRKKAVGKAKELIAHIDKARGNLQFLRGKRKGDDREALTTMLQELQALQQELLGAVRFPKKIIGGSKDDWDTAVATSLNVVKKIPAKLGNVWKGLESFHK